MSNFFRNALKEFYGNLTLWGTDSNSADVPLRANTERGQLQIEPVENWVQVDPVVLGTGANTVVYNPGSSATELYLIEYEIENYGAADLLVSVGFDIGATGSLTHYSYRGYVPIYCSTGWRGPYVMAGNDDFMAWCGSATAASLHFRIRKVLR